ncbi:MAG TPA: NAD(P)-binding protein, partial [Acidimicrobiales bacterium]|nr:NAD(P)-binding protein [Acidimicrobiales bacterium]
MTTTEELGFDPDALRAKYQAERDKRLRSDGAEQYIELTGRFAHYYEEDPYVDAPLEREPVNAEANVVVIGGGFSGLLAGARLTEIGIDDFNIIEAGADFGGTWY